MIYIIIILVIFIVDYKIKHYIEENKIMHKREKILKGNIILERYHNKGVMLNFLEDKVDLVKKITGALIGILFLFFALILPKKGNQLLKLGLALILGGACSNVYDRFHKGYVVDYFSFKFLKKIVFNISDIFIFIGSVIIMIVSLTKKK